MGDRPTLILTTRLGVRPLGVRGDALHNVAGQLLAVIRRRLGDGPANLLAEPQLREAGDGIDWYASRSGEVRRFGDLSESERAATLETVETRLGAIRSLGGVLKESTGSEEARLIGRSLELATARPSDDFIFLVDGEPVIAAWGYEADAAAGLAAFAPPPVPMPAAAGAGRAGERTRRHVARAARLGAVAECAAVRPAAPAAALDHLVAAARLRAGRSLAQHRHPGDARSARARGAARSDAAPEGLARFGGGRPEQAQGRACGSRRRAQGQGRAVQADRTAQAAATATATTGGQGTAASAAATAGRRAAGAAAPPTNRPPPGQLPCNWSGDSGGEGVTRNRHYLGDRPGFVGINYNLYVKPDDIKVMYRGQNIAGTGGPRSGRGGFGFNWNPVAGDYSVDVIVTGEMWGTRWTYAMVCPR